MAAAGSWLHAEGDVWAVGFDGAVVRVKDSKGLRYLAALLTAPGVEIHALDLVHRVDGRAAPAPADRALGVGRGDAGPVIDERARAEYRSRLRDLQEEIDEATTFHDSARAARAQEEMDFLVHELSGAFGLGGRARVVGSDAERARVAVRRAIKAAMERLADAHPELGEHLQATIRTGTYCAYHPDPRSGPWLLGRPDDAGGGGLPSGVVAFLLTDIVDSTRMWEQDPTAMAQALAAHDALIATVVAAAGGVVIKSKGEGDSTLSVFARASDAASAAVEAQRQLAAQIWPGGVQLDVRMALHAGEAHERDGDYFGPTVNRAARLRGIAVGRQIVVSSAAAALIEEGLPPDTTLVAGGVRRLRGMSRDETYYVLAGPGLVGAGQAEGSGPELDPPAPNPDAIRQGGETPGPAGVEDRPPLPIPLRPGGSPFAGRRAELARLDRAWHGVASGVPAAVFLGGEPGIGKSALAAEFARRRHADGAGVLFGRCEEDLDIAYQPFAEAIRPYLARLGPGGWSDPAIRPAAELARVIPTTGSSSDGGADRLGLFEAVATVLRHATAGGPVLVVLDDLHWAAKPTTLLLGHLLRTAEPIPMLVVGTFRDTELEESRPLAELLADLRGRDRVERIPLTGLAVGDTCALIEADAAAPLARADRDFAVAAHHRSKGNPLFARELFRHFAESGTTGGRLPEGVREVIGQRLVRLPAATTRALSVAALVGSRFSLDVLERVPDAADDADQLIGAIEPALRSKLIDEVPGPGAFAFTHALVRETLAARLSAVRRSRLHYRIGDAIESLPDAAARDGELAYHYAEAGREDRGVKAAAYAVRAGRDALAGLAHEQAVAVLERAIEVVQTHGDVVPADLRVSLLLNATRAHFLNHDLARCLDRAERTAQLAGDIDDIESWGRAHLTVARARSMHDPTWVGRAAPSGPLEDFLRRTEGQETSLRIDVLLHLAEVKFASFEFDRGLELATEAVALAERTGDEAAGAKANRAAGLNHLGRLELDAAAGQFRASARRMPRSADPWIEGHARTRLGLVRLLQGDLEEADDEASAAGELMRPLDQGDYALAVSCRVAIATAQGRFEDTEAYGAEGERAFERSQYAFAAPILFPAWAGGRALQGDWSGASSILDRWERSGGRGAWRYRLLAGALTGASDLAPADLSVLGAHARNRPTDLFSVPSLAAEAEIADWAGGREPLTGAYERLAHARANGVVFCLGWTLFVPRLLGIAATALGRHGEAREALAEAEALAETTSPIERARTLEARARLLLAEGGSPAHAAELVEQAARAFDELGALALLGRAMELGGSLPGFSFRPAPRFLLAVGAGTDSCEAGVEAFIRDQLCQWRGVPFTAAGAPYVVAWFESEVAAASCAREIQIATGAGPAAPSEGLQVRVALGIGRPSGRGADLFGVASRDAVASAEAASPGELGMSADAAGAAQPARAWT